MSASGPSLGSSDAMLLSAAAPKPPGTGLLRTVPRSAAMQRSAQPAKMELVMRPGATTPIAPALLVKVKESPVKASFTHTVVLVAVLCPLLAWNVELVTMADADPYLLLTHKAEPKWVKASKSTGLEVSLDAAASARAARSAESAGRARERVGRGDGRRAGSCRLVVTAAHATGCGGGRAHAC